MKDVILFKVNEGQIVYWSKSEAFLLPLTGLSKSQKYTMNSFLFWDDYSIENYNLIIRFIHDDYDEFINYFNKLIAPTLDKNGYAIEMHDFHGESILILDMSQWAIDINLFLEGKYSKISIAARKIIMEYHSYWRDGSKKVPLHISSALTPYRKMDFLDGLSPVEYICRKDTYGFDRDIIDQIGEIANLYDRSNETLVIEPDKMTGIYGGNNICTI